MADLAKLLLIGIFQIATDFSAKNSGADSDVFLYVLIINPLQIQLPIEKSYRYS